MTQLEQIRKTNYELLQRLVGSFEALPEVAKSVVPGFMDLNLDVTQRDGRCIELALSHYYKHPSGDLIADPDMVLRVDVVSGTVDALSYQDAFGYHEVYSCRGFVNRDQAYQQNRFLTQWLRNCIEQGHRLVVPGAAADDTSCAETSMAR